MSFTVTESSSDSSHCRPVRRKNKVSFTLLPTESTVENSDHVARFFLQFLSPVAKEIAFTCHIDPHNFDDDTLISSALYMFDHYQLYQKFFFSPEACKFFLYTVKDHYRDNNAFHNFKHAFSVLHLLFQVLHCGGGDQYLTSLDIYALFIAAICHDIGHPGHSNLFEIASNNSIFQSHGHLLTDSNNTNTSTSNSTNILEVYHADCTVKLLTSSSMHELLFSRLPTDVRDELLALVHKLILSTEMALHNEHVEKIDVIHSILAEKFQHTNSATSDLSVSLPQDLRTSISSIFLHMSDIGIQTSNTTVANDWMFHCYKEFQSQAQKEMTLGICTASYLHDIDSEAKIYNSQCGFIKFVVLPLWQKALVKLLPKLQPCIENLEKNLEYYQSQVNIPSNNSATATNIN
jgi:hypothetical protein